LYKDCKIATSIQYTDNIFYMKIDIENRNDIEMVVNAFYEKVKTDDILGPVFNVLIPVNWDTHLPVMYQFWENIIFHTGSYTGNPMTLHKYIQNKISISADQFDRWIQLFNQTTDELFEGKNASLAKQRAAGIAAVMKHKILTEHKD
jgi:hemoglobin